MASSHHVRERSRNRGRKRRICPFTATDAPRSSGSSDSPISSVAEAVVACIDGELSAPGEGVVIHSPSCARLATRAGGKPAAGPGGSAVSRSRSGGLWVASSTAPSLEPLSLFMFIFTHEVHCHDAVTRLLAGRPPPCRAERRGMLAAPVHPFGMIPTLPHAVYPLLGSTPRALEQAEPAGPAHPGSRSCAAYNAGFEPDWRRHPKYLIAGTLRTG